MTEVTKIGNNIIFIRRDWMNSNSVLFTGVENVLVDTGYIKGISPLLSQLKECGVEPEEMDLIINTHFHSDHVGANLAIKERSGAAIATGGIEAEYINKGDRWANWLDFTGQEAPAYSVDRALAGGETIRLGNHWFQVIDTPGHSPGGISFYCPELRLLLSGDALWGRDFGPLNCVIHGPQAIEQARESLQRLAQLDVEVCLPGHGAAIMDHQENVAHCIRKFDKIKGDLQAVALHFITRVFTFMVMVEGGMDRERLGKYFKGTGWLEDFNRLYFGMALEELIDMVMTKLFKSGAVREEKGIITAGG